MKILHLDENHPFLIAKLMAMGFVNETDITSSKEKIEDFISSYEGVVIRSRFPIDKHFIDAAIKLKFIARVGAGLENIDVDYAQSKGIRIISSPEGNANAVGEHALAMILNLFNKITRADQQIRQGQWIREDNRGEEMDGKTVGIIGYGNTGRAFAKKLKGFDVKVLCYDIKKNIGDHYAFQVPLKVLQQKSNIISLHVPQTEKTQGMVNKGFINNFFKPFWLINTSRGSCVRTKDLIEALLEGTIRGAALDVLEYEKPSFEALQTTKIPKQIKQLMKFDNVLLTPHIAGWSFQSKEKMAQIIVKKIKEVLRPNA